MGQARNPRNRSRVGVRRHLVPAQPVVNQRLQLLETQFALFQPLTLAAHRGDLLLQFAQRGKDIARLVAAVAANARNASGSLPPSRTKAAARST